MDRLTIKEKLGYGLGDTASNLVWQTAMLFLAFYYTDVYGLDPATMGTMFLLLRAMDAITDPLMGGLVDRTRTRFGQFRPYILGGAVPFGIACAITFYTPPFGATGKLIYAYLTYGFLTLCYTAINVPYCAMASSLTQDPQQRVSLQSWRFALSTAGGVIVSLGALPLVGIIGKGNQQIGYFGAMAIMGVLGMVLFFVCFASTRERVRPAMENHSMAADFRLLMHNSQWWIIALLNVVLLTAVIMRGTSTMYYVKYVMGRPDLATAFITSGIVASIAGAMVSAPLLGKWDKVRSYKMVIFLTVIAAAWVFYIPPQNLTLLFIGNIVFGFVSMMSTPLLWSMMSDVVDYEELRSGRRLSGLVFATVLFTIKLGLAFGGALVGWILGYLHYDPTLPSQSAEVLQGISLLFTWGPALFYLPIVFLMLGYRLTNKRMQLVIRGLERQRQVSPETDSSVPPLTGETVPSMDHPQH